MTPGHRARDLLAICAGAALTYMAIHLGHSPPS